MVNLSERWLFPTSANQCGQNTEYNYVVCIYVFILLNRSALNENNNHIFTNTKKRLLLYFPCIILLVVGSKCHCNVLREKQITVTLESISMNKGTRVSRRDM